MDAVRPFLRLDHGPDGYLVDLVSTAVRDVPAGFGARVLKARAPLFPAGISELSPRERDVLVGLHSLDSLDEIADGLGVSVNTVKTHLRGIYVKLGVATRRDAVVAAYRHGHDEHGHDDHGHDEHGHDGAPDQRGRVRHPG
ncbi:MAG: response regulator transcription factor [Pseudonocardia sp.]